MVAKGVSPSKTVHRPSMKNVHKNREMDGFDGRTDSLRLHQRPSVQSVRHKLDGLMDGMDGRITFRFRPSIRPSIRPFRPS